MEETFNYLIGEELDAVLNDPDKSQDYITRLNAFNAKRKGVKPWDLLDKNMERASDEVETKRYELCKVCPEFIKLTGQCKKCGCIMKGKVKLHDAFCPIGKW